MIDACKRTHWVNSKTGRVLDRGPFKICVIKNRPDGSRLRRACLARAAEWPVWRQRYRANALFVLESGDVWITPDWQDAVRLAA